MRRNAAGVMHGDVLKKCSPQIHEITRKAASRLLAQLIPSLGGFVSIHVSRCSTNVAA